jgi:hypothetical protein
MPGSDLRCALHCTVTLVALLLISLPGCGRHAATVPAASPQQQRFSRLELLDDVEYIFATIHAVHPNSYHRVDSLTVAQARRALERALRDNMTSSEFWRLAAPAVAMLRDGHTSLSRPGRAASDTLVFPLVLRVDSFGATVRADLSDSQRLPAGTRILRINERPVPDLIHEAMATLSYELDAMRLWVVERNVGDILPAVWEWYGPWEIRAKLRSGDSIRAVVAAIPAAVRSARLATAGLLPAPAPPYTFATTHNGAIGFMDLRLQIDTDQFQRFLRETFARLHEDSPCALVIDLRRDAGGSSELGDRLMSYLTRDPVRQYSRIVVRTSAQVKADHRARLPAVLRWMPAGVLGLADRRFGALLGSEDGSLIEWTESERSPRDNPLRWDGPVFALTGVNTFSSGADLAAALQDYGLATIIGEETGGLASSYGESYMSTLPHTRLRLSVSFKYFVRPSGAEDGRGVRPDVAIPGNGNDATGDDAAIGLVLEEVGECALAKTHALTQSP